MTEPRAALRSLTAFFLGAATLAAGWLGLVALQYGAPTESSRALFGINDRKHQAAVSKPSPKLIIAGGSNGYFGIYAELLESKTGVPTVNLATNAGLGIRYILELVERVAKPGDSVLLTLEYDHYTFTHLPTEVLVDYVWSRDPGYFWQTDFLTKARLIYSMSPYRLVYGVHGRFWPPARRVSFYNPETITTTHGDETLSIGYKIEPAMLERIKALEPVVLSHYGWKGNQLPEGAQDLADFVERSRRKGIQVLFSWPSTIRPRGGSLEKPENQAALRQMEAFWAALRVPVLGSAEQFMYEPEKFFDTRYHLNEFARVERTLLLSRLLVPYLRPRTEPASKLLRVNKEAQGLGNGKG